MNKKFLDKVIDQIVYETEIDYDRKVIGTPFSSILLPLHSFIPFLSSSFLKQCRDVYGLNEQEIEYVWEEYREIIKDIIKNNG
jgi:hypothetical protein